MTQPNSQLRGSGPRDIRQDTSTPASALRICIGQLENTHVGRKVRLYGRCVDVSCPSRSSSRADVDSRGSTMSVERCSGSVMTCHSTFPTQTRQDNKQFLSTAGRSYTPTDIPKTRKTHQRQGNDRRCLSYLAKGSASSGGSNERWTR